MTDVKLEDALDGVQKVVAELRSNHEQLVTKYDGVLNDQEKRLEAATADSLKRMDEIEKSIKRQEAIKVGVEEGQELENRAYGEAFGRWVRNGDSISQEDKDLLQKRAVDGLIGTGAAGGFLASPAIVLAVERALRVISPMRQLATVIQSGVSDIRIPINDLGAASGWVGETTARPKTNTPDFREIRPLGGELYAEPRVSNWFIEDAFVNVDQFMADEISDLFAFQEGAVYINGTGTNQPRGIMAETFTSHTADLTADVAVGTIGQLKTGVAAALSANPYDQITQLINVLKPGYVPNAVFMMNRTTLAAHMSVKDTTGNYIWRASYSNGLGGVSPSTLLGFPVYIDDGLPSVAANARPILFGDIRSAYIIVDRVGLQVTRNPFRETGYVIFMARKRVFGITKKHEAVKALQVAV
jgi:HK97 family phage major capsid protein